MELFFTNIFEKGECFFVMGEKENIAHLFGDDKKPSLEYMTLYDMVCEILKRVVFIEQSVRKTVRIGKHSKGRES